MVAKKPAQTLYIFMNGIHVGALSRKTSGQLQFQYDELWLQHPNRRPISLSMAPLTPEPFTGDKVENFFDNLLPDNENIRRRIRTRFQTRSTECFDLLSEIGSDCVGALQILQQPNIEQQQSIKASPINDTAIASLLKHYQTAPLGMQSDIDFRISIAGAQEKTALLWYKNQWHIPQGTTPTSHIIKLPIGYNQHSGMDLSDSVENEWLCLQILAAYGLPVNQATITVFDHM
jgi:serine/threonine-protein kinase HipA